MKKLFTFYFVLLLSIIVIGSCTKDKEQYIANSKTELIKEAQKNYDDELLKQDLPRLNSTYNVRHAVTKTVLWEKAQIRKISLGDAVITPIQYEKQLFVKQGKDELISLDKLSYLMTYKNKKGETQQELVTTIPYTQTKSNNGKFVGMVIVEDLKGNFKKGYAYNENGDIRRIYLEQTQIFRKVNNFRTISCSTIEMWGQNFWENGQSEMYLISSQTYCFNNSGGGADQEEDQTTDPDGGGGGSTGGGDYNPPTGGNIATKIDLSLFDRLSYPVLGQIVDGLYNKVKNDPKLMAAIKNFSHLSEQQILSNLKTGQGPKLVVKTMPNVAGHFNRQTNTIEIAHHVVSATNYVLKDYSNALELYIAVSILHEFIHFGENYTQIFLPYNNPYNDPGFQFENQYYGGRVSFNYATGEITYERN